MAFRLYPFKVPFENRGRIEEIPADFYKTVYLAFVFHALDCQPMYAYTLVGRHSTEDIPVV